MSLLARSLIMTLRASDDAQLHAAGVWIERALDAHARGAFVGVATSCPDCWRPLATNGCSEGHVPAEGVDRLDLHGLGAARQLFIHRQDIPRDAHRGALHD